MVQKLMVPRNCWLISKARPNPSSTSSPTDQNTKRAVTLHRVPDIFVGQDADIIVDAGQPRRHARHDST